MGHGVGGGFALWSERRRDFCSIVPRDTHSGAE